MIRSKPGVSRNLACRTVIPMARVILDTPGLPLSPAFRRKGKEIVRERVAQFFSAALAHFLLAISRLCQDKDLATHVGDQNITNNLLILTRRWFSVAGLCLTQEPIFYSARMLVHLTWVNRFLKLKSTKSGLLKCGFHDALCISFAMLVDESKVNSI